MPDSPTPPRPRLLFTTPAYARMGSDLLRACAGLEAGRLERKSFPDGEHYLRLLSPLAGRDVVVLGATHSDSDTLDLYDLACGVVDSGCHRLLLLICYFGYSTMERAVKAGEVVTAKSRARLLSSLPAPGSGSQVVLLDLHVESIAHYFEGNLRPWHLQGRPVVLGAIRELAEGAGDFVLASTDAGRAKIVESLANDLRVGACFVFKRRLDSGATEVSAVSAQVQGKHVIIYDDSAFGLAGEGLLAPGNLLITPSPLLPPPLFAVIRTGGSLVGAAAAYRDAGARRISVVATHGVFAGDALARLRGCGLIDFVAVTDSHPAARAAEGDFVRVHSIVPLLAEFIRGQ